MHIAWLGKKTPFCGNVTYGREVTNALIERGHRVSFFHFEQGGTLGDLPPHSSRTLANPHDISVPYLYKSQIYTVPSIQSIRILVNALKRLKPDVVHASLTLSFVDFLLPKLCADLGIPLVATFHPPFDDKRRSLTSLSQHVIYQIYAPFLAHYKQVIVFSNIQRQLLIRLGVPAKTVTVIPNGVDVMKYAPGPSDIKRQLRAKQLFVYQGRLSIEKNVVALLRAWKASNLGPEHKLAIVGDGPLASSLMDDYPASDDLIWLGFVGDEQKRINILRGADVFILPSQIEGLSLSLLEAMACGTACLATDAGADGEVLEDGAGIILSADQVEEQLITLLPMCQEQPELTNLLGQQARLRVLERYTLSRNISQVEEVYARVVERQQMLYFNEVKAI
ncbi:MAG: glycosyltransferase family 4 protein [Cyanobacteria bacterium P01_F01_bin.150]